MKSNWCCRLFQTLQSSALTLNCLQNLNNSLNVSVMWSKLLSLLWSWAWCVQCSLRMFTSLGFPGVCLPLLDHQCGYNLDKSTQTTWKHNIHPKHSPRSTLCFILLFAAALFPNRCVTTSQEVAPLPSLFLKATQHLLWVWSLKKEKKRNFSEWWKWSWLQMALREAERRGVSKQMVERRADGCSV